LSLLVGAATVRPVGRLIDSIGGRLAMTAGSGLAALGLLIAAVAPSLPVYFTAWAILGLAMRLVLYEAAFATLTHAGGRDARRAISVLTLYGGFASTVFWPVGWALIEAFGWRATFAVFAALHLVVCLPLHAYFLSKMPAAAAPAGIDPSPILHPGAALTGRDRTVALMFLTVAFALLLYVNSVLSAHLIDTLVAFGFSSGTAVSVAAVRGIGQFAGRLWEILFAGGLAPMTLCLVAVGLTPLAFVALFLGAGVATASLFAFGQGASNGLVTIARGVVPLLLFGPAGYGLLVGTMTTPGLIAMALAPAIHAAMVELWGHMIALAACFVAAVVGFLLVVALTLRIRRREP
jgi:predicted MFS family arabinose efflux permease